MLIAPRSAAARSLLEQCAGIAAQLRAGGTYLGVTVQDVTSDLASSLKLEDERGVLVRSVEEGSPAEEAGIRPGDVLLAYNGENILGREQFARMVQETPSQRKVKVQIWRGGKVQTLIATTGSWPLPASYPQSAMAYFGPLAMDIPSPLVVWKNLLLGIEYEPLSQQLAHFFAVQNGLLVRSVDKSSPADRAGLRAGDILTAIGERSLQDSRDLNSYFRVQHEHAPRITLTVERDHKQMSVSIAVDRDR
jgi:serine protease Do